MTPQATRKRTEFSNRQKAEIFVRDRATCAFSGKSLWILDYGASPTYDVDWVDHIKPSMRGGTNATENGICASSFFNAKKRDNSSDNQYFFMAGKPTEHFFRVYEEVPEKIAGNLRRFSKLEQGDWYFNRALSYLLFAIEWLTAKEQGTEYKRGIPYYAGAALRMLRDWRRIAPRSDAETFTERKLVPRNLKDDQAMMLTLAGIESEEEFDKLTHQLYPYYRASEHVIREFVTVEGKEDAERFLKNIKAEPFLSPRMKGIAELNAVRLYLCKN